jgi:hypothetical protein
MATRLIGTDSTDPWLPTIVKVHAASTQVLDTAGHFTATDVEGALAELQDTVNALVVSGGALSAPTVDTGEVYRLIMFSDGRTRAIPITATNPGIPTGFARTVRVNSVKLTWTAGAGATSYIVYRNGGPYVTVTDTAYRDRNVTVGETYTYAVRSVSPYELRSAITTDLTAFIDPALNIAPTVEVRTWPATVAAGNRAVVRVNAIDADAQLLADTLNVDVGTLIATADPSVWNLVP